MILNTSLKGTKQGPRRRLGLPAVLVSVEGLFYSTIRLGGTIAMLQQLIERMAQDTGQSGAAIGALLLELQATGRIRVDAAGQVWMPHFTPDGIRELSIDMNGV